MPRHNTYKRLQQLRTEYAGYFTERQRAFLDSAHGKSESDRLVVLMVAMLRTAPGLEEVDKATNTGNWQSIGLDLLASQYRSAVLWNQLSSTRADQLMIDARLLTTPGQLLKACADAYAARQQEDKPAVMQGGKEPDLEALKTRRNAA